MHERLHSAYPPKTEFNHTTFFDSGFLEKPWEHHGRRPTAWTVKPASPRLAIMRRTAGLLGITYAKL
jgi:hypothetical protein